MHTHTEWHAPLLDAVECTALKAATPDLTAAIARLRWLASAAGDIGLVRGVVDDLSNEVYGVWMVYMVHGNGAHMAIGDYI